MGHIFKNTNNNYKEYYAIFGIGQLEKKKILIITFLSSVLYSWSFSGFLNLFLERYKIIWSWPL